MVPKITIALCLILLSSNCNSKLIQSIEVCRHGARAALGSQFDDPALMKYDVAFGELTASGMRQHLLLGSELRARFTEDEQFLDPNYNATEIYVRSTDVDRTLQSAESQLLGLFPLTTGLSLPNPAVAKIAVPPMEVDGLTEIQERMGLDALPAKYQPIPINTLPTDQDYMLTPWSGACDRLNELIDESKNSPQAKAFFDKYLVPVLTKVQKVTGIDTSKFTSDDAVTMFHIFDDFSCGIQNGNPLPAGADEEFLNDIYLMAEFYFYYYYWQWDETVRLGTTELWNTVIANFKAKTEGASSNKFTLFSAHDTTIAAILMGLKQEKYYPKFASNIFFNLHEREGNADTFLGNESRYYVTVTFNDQPLTLETCGGVECDMDTFMKFLESRTVPDLKEACESKKNALSLPTSSQE